MKVAAALILFFNYIIINAQNNSIIKILNQELKKELKYQKKDSVNYYGERFQFVKNFTIDHNILSLEVKKKRYYDDIYYTQKQEIDLRKIKTIIKDINIIFETEPDAVKITETNEKGEKTFRNSDMFFLYLSYEKQNENLADDLIEVFKKAGYTIIKGFWYD